MEISLILRFHLSFMYSNKERFDKLDKDHKQMVLDKAIDLLFDSNPEIKFRYHGYVKNENVEQVFVADK